MSKSASRLLIGSNAAGHDWQMVSLGSVIDPERPITYGVVQPGEHDPTGIPLVRGGDFSDGWLPLSQYRRVSPRIERSFARARLKTGDVVITIKGDVGTAAIVPAFLDGANISQTNARLAIDVTKALPVFILAFLQSTHGRRQIAAVTQVGAQPGLIFRDILTLRLRLPSLAEQRRIVLILEAWDQALEKLKGLYLLKEKRLNHLRSTLLAGTKRTKGRRVPWETKRLATVTEEITRRNADSRLSRSAVMGVTNDRGIVPMREHTISDDISRYKRLPANAFAYNPMRINVGSIDMNRGDRDLLVSPDYVVFACKIGTLDPDYLYHLTKTHWWRHHINRGASGSVRQRTYYEDLAAMRLPLPDIKEQRNIVAILNSATQELALTKKLTESLEIQRQGLIDSLLAGKRRVKEVA